MRITLLFWTLSTLLYIGCSAVTLTNDSPPEEQFAAGEKYQKSERFMEAIERYRILKSRYPYSKYAALATLRIADCHFSEEAYIEAAAAYRLFRELYPKHEESAYAQMRIADSYYLQLPGSIDRDLDPAADAISNYEILLKQYPQFKDKELAQNRIKELRQKLAEKEDYVGNFYFIREFYNSSAARYRNLLDRYPEAGLNERALYRLAFSYEKIGEYARAEETIERLRTEFPKGEFDSRSEDILKKIPRLIPSVNIFYSAHSHFI
jgi:outer membrane protein assembly factor BamD